MLAPCYNCPNRHLGCHLTCELYSNFKKECEKLRQIRFSESKFREYTSDHFNKIYHNRHIRDRGR